VRGRNLTAADLAPLAHCPRVEQIYVRGIDDPGEPLAFLESMPQLDQCLVLGSPRVGRVRLSQRTGVQRFYFKYGQLDELVIDGAPRLTDVHLGHTAFGYNDDDARLPRLDIGRLTVRDAPNLRYLMVDGQASKLPWTDVALADCPRLRSLTLHAPPPEIQPTKCRLTTGGTFPELVQRKLAHLVTNEASLTRLDSSPLFHGGTLDSVEVEPGDKQ